jgi:hypothetical protein
MSEYQYYEFAAMDRPLDAAAMTRLRSISSRARITSTSFVNHYEWGDLKADPMTLMERYFDLFLYVANWGTRRFALRLPTQFLRAADLEPFGLVDELVTIRRTGEHVIVDISCDDEGAADELDDGSGSLSALSPLRGAVISGDLRLFSMLWLLQVDYGLVPDDAMQPPGIAPLSAPLSALAEFLCLNLDLLEVATQTPASAAEPSAEAVESFIRALPEEEKVAWLTRVYAGTARHLGAELQRRVRAAIHPATRASGRTAGELREAARRIGDERRRLAEARETAQRRRREREATQARARYLSALSERGEAAWREVEALISLRNPSGYERAAALIADLGEVAAAGGANDGFARRLADLRTRHGKKGRLIERLGTLDLPEG